MHAAILKHIESLGWAVTVFRMGEYCELHAVKKPDGSEVKIARAEDDGDEEVYLAACALAEMCGVDLEG